ncbi:hypothetical protein CCMA1212_009850 [Trichoderma ghanense]|uniref:Uncharacterized protein n=1 Tax=Trichoderma ghanense TaxID=65468 RepID=A0ABY2GRF7_9HYPO
MLYDPQGRLIRDDRLAHRLPDRITAMIAAMQIHLYDCKSANPLTDSRPCREAAASHAGAIHPERNGAPTSFIVDSLSRIEAFTTAIAHATASIHRGPCSSGARTDSFDGRVAPTSSWFSASPQNRDVRPAAVQAYTFRRMHFWEFLLSYADAAGSPWVKAVELAEMLLVLDKIYVFEEVILLSAFCSQHESDGYLSVRLLQQVLSELFNETGIVKQPGPIKEAEPSGRFVPGVLVGMASPIWIIKISSTLGKMKPQTRQSNQLARLLGILKRRSPANPILPFQSKGGANETFGTPMTSPKQRGNVPFMLLWRGWIVGMMEKEVRPTEGEKLGFWLRYFGSGAVLFWLRLDCYRWGGDAGNGSHCMEMGADECNGDADDDKVDGEERRGSSVVRETPPASIEVLVESKPSEEGHIRHQCRHHAYQESEGDGQEICAFPFSGQANLSVLGSDGQSCIQRS